MGESTCNICISLEDLYPEYKELLQFNEKKLKEKKGVSYLNKFTKDRQKANKHVKNCSILLVIREMHIKYTMRYCYTHQSDQK